MALRSRAVQQGANPNLCLVDSIILAATKDGLYDKNVVPETIHIVKVNYFNKNKTNNLT